MAFGKGAGACLCGSAVLVGGQASRRAKIQRVMESETIRFGTIKDAKDFLAERIALQAKREGEPLSEVERKMLYFSETGWTLPDMQAVSAEFDRDCDEDEYEQKIAGLVRKIDTRNHAENPVEEAAWDDAVLKLSEGDHYLSVLINMAAESEAATVGHGFIPTLDAPAVRPRHDRLKLWVTASAAAFGIFVIMGLYALIFGH
jgi:hypothetical protein